MITILAVALDPFVQQLLRYPIRSVQSPSPSTITKKARIFNASSVTDEFVTAVDAGVWAHACSFARNPPCASGNCSWPTFKSVGWCSACEDITSSASISGCDYNVNTTFLPKPGSGSPAYQYNGYSYNRVIPCEVVLDKGASAPYPLWGGAFFAGNNSLLQTWTMSPTEIVWVSNGTNASDSSYGVMDTNLILHNTTFVGVENPLMVFAHASMRLIDRNNAPKGLTISHVEQCVLSLCERTYETTVTNGIASAKVVSTNWGAFEDYNVAKNKPVFGWNGNASIHEAPGISDLYSMFWVANPKDAGKVRLPANMGTDPEYSAFTIDTDWYNTITSRIIGNGTIPAIYSPNTVLGPSPFAVNYSSDAIESVANNGLSTVIGNVAASLTQLGLEQSDEIVIGTDSVSEVYVDVRWNGSSYHVCWNWPALDS